MSDSKVEVEISGEEQKLASATDKAVADINKVRDESERQASTQKKLVQLEEQHKKLKDDARKAAFDQLPIAERVALVEQQRIKLQHQLNAAVAEGNQIRAAELRNEMQAAATQASRLKSEQGQTGMSGWMASLATRFGPAAIAGYLGFKAKEMASEIMRDAENANDFATRLGTSTTTAQKFNVAGAKSNFDQGQITATFRSLRLAQLAAIGGGKEQLAAFSAFGVSIDQLKNKRPEEIYFQIARNAKMGGESMGTLDDATKLFGRNADVALGAFTDGFAQAADEAERLGLIMNEDMVRRLDGAAKGMEQAGRSMKVAFAPAVEAFAGLGELLATGIRGLSVPSPTGFFGALAGGASIKESFSIMVDTMRQNWRQLGKDINAPGDALRAKAFIDINEKEIQDKIRAAIEGTNDPARKRALQLELDKRIGNGGVISETERLNKEIERQREALRFSSLTKEQQLLELTQKRAQLEKEIAASRDNLTKAQKELELVQVDKAIQELDKADSGSKTQTTRVDSLHRIGGFIGGRSDAINAALGAPNKQVIEQLRNLQETSRKQAESLRTVQTILSGGVVSVYIAANRK